MTPSSSSEPISFDKSQNSFEPSLKLIFHSPNVFQLIKKDNNNIIF